MYIFVTFLSVLIAFATMLFSALYYIIVFTIIGLLGLKLKVKLCTGWNRSYTCLVGKTAIVTGANTGIGYWTALDFAKRGARVILACRNQEKAEAAKKKIIEATGNENVVVKLVSFTSLKSVRDFCKDVNENEERLDILVNNAGAGGLGNNITEDGLQITWQVNHFSAFLITHLLIDKLKKSAPSRVVNVASIMAKYGDVKEDNINVFDKDNATKQEYYMYNRTKQSNVLFTRILAKKLAGTGVTTYVLHPGTIATDIFRRLPKYVMEIWNFILKHVFKSSEEGAQTTIYCAVSKDVQNSTGRMYDECSEIAMYESCTDLNLAQQLWRKSEDLTQLLDSEKI